MTDCKPFLWYDDDTGDTYTNEAVSEGAAPEGLRPLYDRPKPDDTALLRQALEALEVSTRFVYADLRPQCESTIDALRERLNETCEHEPVLVETLFGDWQFCKHCNRPWTTEMEKAYVARTKPHYEPAPNEGSEP